MIKPDKNLNISVNSQPICTKLLEQSLFFRASQNESKKWYAMIKYEQKLNYDLGGFNSDGVLPR